jgi:hypothetical protein
MTDDEALESLLRAIHKQVVEEGKEQLPYEEWRKHVILCGSKDGVNYRRKRA